MFQLTGTFRKKEKILNTKGFCSAQAAGCSSWFAGQVYPEDPDLNPCKDSAKYCLDLFLKSGKEGLASLDGSFLLLIQSGEELMVLRDRFGSGPQFYYSDEFFSNQLRDLTRLMKEWSLNWSQLSGFLHLGYISAPNSAIEGVKKLPGGELLVHKQQGFSSMKLLQDKKSAPPARTGIKAEEAAVEYKRLHQKAISKRIKGAKKISLLLSGGYDSAGNIAAVREIYDGQIEAFTVGFKDNPWTEVPLAEKMAETFNADLKSYHIDGSEIDELPSLVASLGDPFQEGGVMVNFKALQLAAKHQPDIILGGDGNDQHFGTAGRELAINYLMRKSGLQWGQKIFHNFYSGRSDIQDNRSFKLFFHNRKILNILNNDEFGFLDHEVAKMTGAKPPMQSYRLGSKKNVYRSIDHLFYHHHNYVDVEQIIKEVILFKAGQVAQLFGVKMAFPYMDYEVSDFILSLPRELRFTGSLKALIKGGGVSKYVHKLTYRDALPTEIATRKKQGGFAPLAKFLATPEAVAKVRRLLDISTIDEAGFDKKYANEYLERYEHLISQPVYWFWHRQVQSFKVFNILVLLVWWETMNSKDEIKLLQDIID